MIPRFLRAIALWALLPAAFVRAHDAGLSQAEARLSADALTLTVSYDLKDVRRMLPPGALLGTDSSDHTIGNASGELQRLAGLLVKATSEDATLVETDTVIEFLPSDHLGFRFIYPRPVGDTVSFTFTNLGALSATHREYFTYIDDKGLIRVEKILSARENQIELSLRPAPPPVPVVLPSSAPSSAGEPEPVRHGFRGFFILGVEHIWTGYDHLLFLFGLLIVCTSFRSIAAIITCFTVAHSMTLILAALEVVSLPSVLVESAIAASIVFVGVENLVRRGGAPRGRPALTFAFGLIHGFGFASVLRDLGVGSSGGGLVGPLFAFNLGVEAGQLVVAAVVLPLIWCLRKNERFLRYGVPALSVLVAAAGLYWLLERTLFG